jgi:hypothetical protein
MLLSHSLVLAIFATRSGRTCAPMSYETAIFERTVCRNADTEIDKRQTPLP